MGNRWGEMGRDGDEEISSRATSDQGGRILSQQGGFQVNRRGEKGSKGDSARGDKKARGKRQCIMKLNV
jgi:hypothetical protein